MGKVFTREDYIKLKEANNGSTDLVIPEGYDEIGERAFAESDLTSIEIPSTVKEIGIGAFAYTALTSIEIPSTVKEIDYEAFRNCTQLQQVKFAEGSVLEEIHSWTFAYTALTSIEIPSTVKKIVYEAFCGCTQLQQVKFAEGSVLEEIGIGAFAYTALTSIEIPSTVKEIVHNAFCECTQLQQVKFSEGSELEEIGSHAFARTALTSIEIPSTVKKIGSVFWECTQLQQVKFAEGSELEEIGSHAFAYTALTSIEIPSTVKKIVHDAFWECTQLQQVKFAEGSELEEIGSHAFAHTALTSIELPLTAKRIVSEAFACTILTSIEFSEYSKLEELIDRFSYQIDLIKTEIILQISLLEYDTLFVKNFSFRNLVIKCNDYQQLAAFFQNLNISCNTITLLGKKLSRIEKFNIKSLINKVIGNKKTEIIFKESKITEETQPVIAENQSVLSKENEELLGKIESAIAIFPKDLQVPLNNKLSSLLEEYNQKLNQAKPNINDYLNPTSSLQVELSMEGDLEHWLFSKLLEIQSSLIHYDSIIFGLKRLEDCRELLKLEIESKPKELTNVEDIIITIMYLVGKVDNNKKQEVLKDLESFFNETGTSYNTQLQLMYKFYENNESNILLPGDEYALPMLDLKIKLLKYMEELSKYVIKVAPYLNILEALNSKEVLEYKGETNSISDTIIGIKYVIPLIKNQVAKQSIEKEFSALCNEFIKKIEDTITRINEVKDNDYLNFEKELTQRLQPLLEKLDIYANQNDYMEQLINCRNMLKSNKKELNPKKAIESYIGETYDLILKLPLNEQELVKQKLLGVIEKWINNMPEEKEGINLLREIYADITEISFSLKEYLGAIEDYSDKTRK